jgi:hypothetical protein
MPAYPIPLLLTMPIDRSCSVDGTDDGSSLLPSGATPKSSHINVSAASGRNRRSGESRRTRRFHGRSPPPTTVSADGAAMRHVGRPATWADTLATVTLPRPAPAGLLSTSFRPQPGRETQRSVRVGFASRVAGMITKLMSTARQAMGGADDDKEQQAKIVSSCAANARARTLAPHSRADVADRSPHLSVQANTRRRSRLQGVHGPIVATAWARPPTRPCPRTWAPRPCAPPWPRPGAPRGRISAPP